MSCGLDICYCQSNSIIYNILYCFNTSHITLYHGDHTGTFVMHVFQYISCYSLSDYLFGIHCRIQVSIHLMLLFIDAMPEPLPFAEEFQYISCYSLSGIVMPERNRGYCFNTSHVTLYPNVSLYFLWLRLFQYISCYSLSHQS